MPDQPHPSTPGQPEATTVPQPAVPPAAATAPAGPPDPAGDPAVGTPAAAAQGGGAAVSPPGAPPPGYPPTGYPAWNNPPHRGLRRQRRLFAMLGVGLVGLLLGCLLGSGVTLAATHFWHHQRRPGPVWYRAPGGPHGPAFGPYRR